MRSAPPSVSPFSPTSHPSSESCLRAYSTILRFRRSTFISHLLSHILYWIIWKTFPHTFHHHLHHCHHQHGQELAQFNFVAPGGISPIIVECVKEAGFTLVEVSQHFQTSVAILDAIAFLAPAPVNPLVRWSLTLSDFHWSPWTLLECSKSIFRSLSGYCIF